MKYTLPLLKVVTYDWIIKWEAVINDGLQPTLFIWTEQQYKKPHNSDVSGWPSTNPVINIFILSFLIEAGAHHCVWQPDGFWRQLGLPAVSVGN